MNYGGMAISQTYDDMVVKAASNGEKVVPSDDYTLQIDIDTEEDWTYWEKNSKLILDQLNIGDVKITVSKSGLPHRHITVTLLVAHNVWARIALQAVLGSHITREALNACRVLAGQGSDRPPIVFFEKDEVSVKFEGRRIVLE